MNQKFELHCHTVYSQGTRIPWEGIAKPEEVVAAAKKKGLDGIAIIDHNTTKALRTAKKEAKLQEIILIPGIEINTKSGHVAGLGVEDSIKSGLSVEETVDHIHDAGGIAVATHPFDIRRHGVAQDFMKCDAIEIFNSLNIDRFANRRAIDAVKDFRIPAVAGSDAHTVNMIGSSTNFMKANNSDEAIKKIKKGRLEFETHYIPMKEVVEWSRIRLLRSYEDVTDYMNLNWSRPKRALGKYALKRFITTRRTNVFGVFAYVCLGTAILYSGIRSRSFMEKLRAF